MKRLILTLLTLVLLHGASLACTSAIVAARRSSEGAALLWKHRDNGVYPNTRIEYISDGKYAYSAVVPDNEEYAKGVYAGINEKGLGVISTATKNLPKASPEEYKACKRRRIWGGVMWCALRECATIDEFEALLKRTKRSRGAHSNFGIGDASGAVAYFEVWDLGYRRYDVSESGNDGFDVRANFSHAGNPKRKGSNVRRYKLMMSQMQGHSGTFSPRDFINYSRSYNSLKYGNVLTSPKPYICNNHTVPRYTSVGAVVIVCDAHNPRMLVMNGHPVSSIAVPVYVKAEHEIPQCVHGDAMRLLSNDFREKGYSLNADKKRVLNKEVVSSVLKINHPKIEMPREMPTNIRAFNADIDRKFAKHARRVRKVLKRF